MTSDAEPMVGFFDPRRGRTKATNRASKDPPAIKSENVPWSRILGRAVRKFGLAEYPEEPLANALENFEEANGRAADATNPEDYEEVQERTFTLLGWDQ